jgi:processive 1,2-diacylglycerol beta-glucosyltransferase
VRPDVECRAVRVLILTADIGAGHDLPAELLAAAIRGREPDTEVAVEDALVAMGPLLHAIGRVGAETILERLRPVFELQYWLVTGFGPTRRLASRLLVLLGACGLLRLVRRFRPDVIVSTYPGSTEIVGALRRAGRIGVPCVSAITDLAALRYWAHPGIDLHLVIHGESRAEVLEIAGPRSDVRHVRGLSRPEFEDAPARAAARAALGLPATAPLVLVSGGGWGIGDVEGAARAARRVGAAVVCLCGTNAGLRARLSCSFAADPHVRVEGFTDAMCTYLAAADALVHSTAGLTMLEAQMCGTRAISYGWGVAHIRANNRAYVRFGLAAVAGTSAALDIELRRALAAPLEPDRSFAALPHAADAVLAFASAAPARPAAR